MNITRKATHQHKRSFELHPCTAIICAAYFAMQWCRADDWPAFRGPGGTGISKELTAPITWSQSNHVQWRFPLPAPANSSPITAHGRVFVTCALESGKKRKIFCVNRHTGNQIWERTAEYQGTEPTHPTNPYCGSTPVADSSRVVVWHGSAGVICYDHDGNELWKTDVGEIRHEWGYASSPILYDHRVILNIGPGEHTFLTALDIKSGKILWKWKEPGGLDRTNQKMVGSWSTPIVANIGGKPVILCSMPRRVIGCDPASGVLLWSCEGLGDQKVDLVYASPLVSGNLGVAFTGWVNGPTIGFRLLGSGDVTIDHRIWLEKQPQRIGSGILLDGHIYIVNAGPGTAQCINAESGKILWTERLEAGESWGSIIMVGKRCYVTSRRGITTVFEPSPNGIEILAMNDLGESSNATPAISDGELFLRTDAALYCIGGKR